LEGKKEVEEQNAQLKLYIAKLEESSTKLQKVVQKKEDALKKSNYTVDSLNSVSCQDSGFEGFFDVVVSIRRKVNELEQNLTQKQTELQETMVELKEVTKELNNRKQILETITKFALNSQISEQ
jgi:prefoldin subunit 5